MTNYRRNFLDGGSYFFTANLADRRLTLLTDHIGRLRAAFREVRVPYPFTIEAAMILPDHLHAIWTLPEKDANFALRWRLIKAAFSRGLTRGERISASRAGKGERGIWQRRCREHTLRDESDFCPAPRLHPLQSGQARVCAAGAGLAVLVVPPLGAARRLSSKLGGRHRGGCPRVRRKVMGFAVLNPSYVTLFPNHFKEIRQTFLILNVTCDGVPGLFGSLAPQSYLRQPHGVESKKSGAPLRT